jgi:hypothetical protein
MNKLKELYRTTLLLAIVLLYSLVILYFVQPYWLKFVILLVTLGILHVFDTYRHKIKKL